MSAVPLGVAEVFRRYRDDYEQRFGRFSASEQRVVHDITSCRTADLGGHLYICDQCGVITERFNSCQMGSTWKWGVGRSKRSTPAIPKGSTPHKTGTRCDAFVSSDGRKLRRRSPWGGLGGVDRCATPTSLCGVVADLDQPKPLSLLSLERKMINRLSSSKYSPFDR